ncbi:1-aminocyclopropane-1-carboxylate deaminase/D-cysteine desulfhydrase [uncultured Chitinophaga sp.]|uniref:1-aminocyclopropane-1-carboxylate deaminase/D-cysteine desulfhydrase n=1 Tax=uncultured Chitinophaga sp. TaxID=339340 RepID=UPI0025E24312|nr:pyridoxal-phosphate dependent enzyme [uncultured Chitinophaga sp.]
MILNFDTSNILQSFSATWLPATIQAAMLRLDRIHPEIQGNKWFKLKYNLQAAEQAGKKRILTFGGAYSNHLAAVAVACKLMQWPCTAIIRGERPPVLSYTLKKAGEIGMELQFISREYYSNKEQRDWEAMFPEHYIIPEGGHNALGAKGCEEILSLAPTASFSHILCAVGTGTTLAGLINAAKPGQQVWGISALKGALSLQTEVAGLLNAGATSNWQLLHHFHEGGYGKITPAVISFMNSFFTETGIPLDGVYTGKMMLALKKLVEQGLITEGDSVLCIHSGGLQGNLSLSEGVLCY